MKTTPIRSQALSKRPTSPLLTPILASAGILVVLAVVLLFVVKPFATHQSAPSPLFNWTARYASVPVAISVDLNSIVGAPSRALVNQDCAQLQSDLNAGSKVPTIPDSSLNAVWRSTLQRGQAIVTSCGVVVKTAGDTAGFKALKHAAYEAFLPLGKFLKVIDNLQR